MPIPDSPTTTMEPILSLTPEQLAEWCRQHGQPAYRADQVRRWILGRGVDRFELMTDLPAPLRQQLAERFVVLSTKVAAHSRASDSTEKLLLELADGHRVECVLMREGPRRTICISTQVGCAMGCVFCASGLGGVVRNLTVGEIVEQMVWLRGRLGASERISHIVVMGMGEPLANLDALIPALETAGNKDAMGISARRVTISTVGLPAAMRRLAEQSRAYHLAVSLHAPDDELRSRLVPVNQKIGIAAIVEAADYYFERTGRQVTYEYVLLAGINDGPDQARRLVALLAGRKAHINLIPYNPVAGLPFRRPSGAAINRFAEALREGGISATVRYSKGTRIGAACGQLRRQHLGEEPKPRTVPLSTPVL